MRSGEVLGAPAEVAQPRRPVRPRGRVPRVGVVRGRPTRVTCMAARQLTASRLREGRCGGSVDQPERAGLLDRVGAVVHPEFLVGALGSFLRC